VRWRADGKPEPWTLIKRDQCRHPAAECAAVPIAAHTARLLGAPDAAAELAAAYWRNVYPLMPDGYRSADCRPAAPWTSGWPTPRGLRGCRPRCSIRAAREADQP
jgi:hypothetical protein